jgi:hypothetical protein
MKKLYAKVKGSVADEMLVEVPSGIVAQIRVAIGVGLKWDMSYGEWVRRIALLKPAFKHELTPLVEDGYAPSERGTIMLEFWYE